MAFKEVCDCEILISEIERETVGRSVRGQRWKCWALWGKRTIRCFSHSMRIVLPQRLFTTRVWL